VSSRPRRALVGVAAALAAFAALPAAAMAANESLAVSAESTQAGGLTDVTATLSFDPTQSAATVVTSLAPGMLGNLGANPSCLAAQQLTPSCQVGTATVGENGTASVVGTLYVVPPQQATDAAGIEFVPATAALPDQYIGVALNPKAPGGLNLTTTFPPPGGGVTITSFTASFMSLDDHVFTRLPSSCSAATSSFTVTYYTGGAAGSASSSFTPTGCANLPYAPALAATITKNATNSGAALALDITQAAGESASRSIAFSLPKGFSPNLTADAACLNATGCQIGTASATSPLLPNAALVSGKVLLSASGLTPAISISFPAPFAITLAGAVDLTTGSVSFANVPDVPLTALSLDITGPNGRKAFTTECTPGNLDGSFTAQSGATHNVASPITLNGCAPTVTGSASGLSTGHPRLRFKVVHAKGGGDVVSVAFGLPDGLKFSRSAFVSHRTCTTLKDKKKKCTVTTLISGLGISGGKAKSVALRAGRVVVTMAKGAGSVSFTISGPLVTETRSLRNEVKRHKAGKLTFTLKVTDAEGGLSTVAVKLKPH
jgi:hypothetical protein